jgi:hypothetical protein
VIPPALHLTQRLTAAPPRVRALLAAGAVAATLLLAGADDPLLAGAGRAALLVAALGGALALVRRRPRSADERPEIALGARSALSRDAAVAILKVRGREFLVGHGPGGVRLLADLGEAPCDEGGRP